MAWDLSEDHNVVMMPGMFMLVTIFIEFPSKSVSRALPFNLE